MRLARDASGNYSYVYSSDVSDESEMEQKIADLEHDIYTLNRDAADEIGELYLQTLNDLKDFNDNVDQQLYAQSEQYKQYVDTRRAMFEQQLAVYAERFAFHNEAISRSQDETALGIVLSIDDLESKNEWYMEQFHQYTADLEQNYKEWQDVADETALMIGEGETELADLISNKTDEIIDKYQEQDSELKELSSDTDQYLNRMKNYTAQWASETISLYDSVISKIREYERAVQTTLTAASEDIDMSQNYSGNMAARLNELVNGKTLTNSEIENYLATDEYLIE